MGFASEQIERMHREELNFDELVERLSTRHYDRPAWLDDAEQLGVFEREDAIEDVDMGHEDTAGEINMAWAGRLLTTEQWLEILAALHRGRRGVTAG